MIYPAISLWQPYPLLIASGLKPWETRSWPAPRGVLGKRIAIHAAKRKVRYEEALALTEGISKKRLHDAGLTHQSLMNGHRGVIVCTALLVGSWIVRDRFSNAFPKGDDIVLSDLTGSSFVDDGFGDYGIGRWCWLLRDVQPLTTPAPCKGTQGWFRWDDGT